MKVTKEQIRKLEDHLENIEEYHRSYRREMQKVRDILDEIDIAEKVDPSVA